MAEILKGAPVAAALNEKTAALAAQLRGRGVTPTLAILRIGEQPGDLSYERGTIKRCAEVGIEVKTTALPTDVGQETLMEALQALNRDPGVHGILVFRPLPAPLDEEAVRRALAPEKDVDGVTDGSLAGVFCNTPTGFTPCTAQAVMELLAYYRIPCAGRRAAVLGRSLVVGRPAALLLTHENATVTLCHSRTQDLPRIAREADILVVCTGKAQGVGRDCFRPGQTVIDVGIHRGGPNGSLCGDVDFEQASQIADAVTPVPGGVGAVTTAVLVSHVAEAAQRALR